MKLTGTFHQRVGQMNWAFGNRLYNREDAPWEEYAKRLVKNVLDELIELEKAIATGSFDGYRDAMCDIQIFTAGEQYRERLDGEDDCKVVLDSLLTRFVKNPGDLAASIAMHNAKGVFDISVEGEYPLVVLRSLSDQPDAPKGKFLKSASYEQPVFK